MNPICDSSNCGDDGTASGYPKSPYFPFRAATFYLVPILFGVHGMFSPTPLLFQQFPVPPSPKIAPVLHCAASDASRTATISPIDQRRSVTPAAIAAVTRSVL